MVSHFLIKMTVISYQEYYIRTYVESFPTITTVIGSVCIVVYNMYIVLLICINITTI